MGQCTPPIRTLEKNAVEKEVFIGTYTREEGHVNGKADGFYRATFNIEDGSISEPELIAELINPSFLKLSDNGRFLYSVSQLSHEDEPTGFLHCFENVRGELKEFGKLPTDGKSPCHIGLDKTNRFIIVSNYLGGVAKLFHVAEDGSVGAADVFRVPEAAKDGRQSWLHSAKFSPDNRLMAIADKGLDKVWLFALDQQRWKLKAHPQVAVDLAKGAGPRHMVWSENGKFLYVINELSNTVNVIGYNKGKEQFTNLQTISTLPENYQETSFCADIHLTPDGNFLYGSNRGHDSVAGFAVDKKTGLLKTIGIAKGNGEFPRNFAIAPNGKYLYLANQNTSNITTFRINPTTGELTSTGVDYEIPTPVCIEFNEFALRQ